MASRESGSMLEPRVLYFAHVNILHKFDAEAKSAGATHRTALIRYVNLHDLESTFIHLI